MMGRHGLLALYLLLLPLLSQGLYEGQSTAEVRLELGDPNGIRSRNDGETWVYSGNITLEFVNDRLVRARGTDLVPRAFVESQTPEPVSTPDRESTSVIEPVPVEAPSEPLGEADLDREIELFSTYKDDPSLVLDKLSPHQPSASQTLLARILGSAIPVFLQFVFLLIAFKWVGAEAAKAALFLIAVVDRLVIAGVRWVFLGLLEFPTTFQADMLVSFIVMLGLVTTLTHARQLPTAIKVVVASKVAGFIAAYLLALFLLHNL